MMSSMELADPPIYIRDAGAGFHIDLESITPKIVRIAVLAGNGKIVLDSFEVPREKALDAITHPARYSELYAEALR